MRHVSAALGELTARAYGLVAAGDLQSAQLLLADALATADADPRHASAALADAAGLHARVLARLGDTQTAEEWAAFAYAAATRLYGTGHEHTIQAAATYATVLHRIGRHGEATRRYAEVIEGLTALQGPESPQVLAAHADLATVEFARGDCDTARARLTEAWDMTREAYGEADHAGIKMLARLGAMERDCGRFTEAHQHLAYAQELCRQHLDPGHPLVEQVAALATAPANPDHLCHGNALPPAPPAAQVPVPEAEPEPEPAPEPQPEPEPEVEPRPEPVPPAVAESWWPTDREDERAEEDEPANLPVPTDHREPPARRRLAPIVLAALVVAGLGAAAVIIGLSALDSQPTGDGRAAAPPAATTSAPAATTPAPSPTATRRATPTPAAPGSPPTGVRLRDNQDTIELRWTYPAGAKGRVRISGAPEGQQQRPFQELPAGSNSFVVHGLGRDTDFCFTVAVLYSNKVGSARPVCTARSP